MAKSDTESGNRNYMKKAVSKKESQSSAIISLVSRNRHTIDSAYVCSILMLDKKINSKYYPARALSFAFQLSTLRFKFQPKRNGFARSRELPLSKTSNIKAKHRCQCTLMNATTRLDYHY
jgi:hypothetical protein